MKQLISKQDVDRFQQILQQIERSKHRCYSELYWESENLIDTELDDDIL